MLDLKKLEKKATKLIDSITKEDFELWLEFDKLRSDGKTELEYDQWKKQFDLELQTNKTNQ